MKIKLSKLRSLIKEAIAAEMLPSDGDYFVWVDEEYNKLRFSEILAAGDLLTATLDDMGAYDVTGPMPGQPGVWFVDQTGTGKQFKPGELVRVPELDSGGKTWAAVSEVDAIMATRVATGPKNDVDSLMLKALKNATLMGVDMSDIQDFSIRLRKNSIVYNFDPDGDRGITGSLLQSDVPGMSLQAAADWLFAHGATKMKPQKRSQDRPYYD